MSTRAMTARLDSTACAGYGNKSEVAELLIDKGAVLDAEAHGAGGTPLIVPLFWGHREVADLGRPLPPDLAIRGW